MNCAYLYTMYFEYDNDKISKIKDIFLNFKFFLQAKDCLSQALSFKRHEISYVMLGKIHLMEGNIEAAIEIYKQAVE